MNNGGNSCTRCSGIMYGIEKSPSPPLSNPDSGDEPASAAAVTVRTESDDGWSSDESKQGNVSLRTYTAYVSAAGGIIAAMAVLVASFIAEGAKGFSVWWLAYWIEQGSGSVNVSL